MGRGAGRVLIAGVANFWGPRVAAQLVEQEGVEAVVAIDDREPSEPLHPAVTFVRGDLRSTGLAALVRAVEPDTVVHNALLQFPEPTRTARTIHDVNVVGTLQLLAACQSLPSLRALVARGSASIYGSEAGAPAFFTEDQARRFPLRTRFQRDVGEIESYVETFARRRPATTCTTLRLQPVVGLTIDTPITRLFRLPVVPTVLGFDPRVQLLHEDDAVGAIVAATCHPVAGAVNVASDGTVSLVRMLRRLRRPALPIPHPVFGAVAARLAQAGGVELGEDVLRYLRYGRGVDTRRLTSEVGFTPRLTTEQAVELVARAREVAA